MAKSFNNLKIPVHIAIIMDGNGRWAKKRLLNKASGHKAGANTLKKLAVEIEKLGVQHLTVYAFSTENWHRPQDEIQDLMNLLREYIQQYIDESASNNMRLDVLGDLTKLDQDLQEKIKHLIQITKDKQGMCIHIALSYGSRDEIIRGIKKLCNDLKNSTRRVGDITETLFNEYLDTAGIPDPDILIRTSGEYRMSNFLLWQMAYTEMFFVDKLWPDFTVDDLYSVLNQYQQRDRRYGGRKTDG